MTWASMYWLWAAAPVMMMCAATAGFIFADAFEDALALLGRRRAVGVGGIAEDDEGVEVGCGGVMGGEGEVGAVEDEGAGEEDDREVEEDSV